MKITLFVSPNCPKCPMAKQIVEQAKKKRSDLIVEIKDVTTEEGYIDALMYNISSTPAIVLGDKVLYQGDVPTLSELLARLDEANQ